MQAWYSVWDPHLVKDIELEKSQKFALRVQVVHGTGLLPIRNY